MSELCAVLQLPQSTVSRHLKTLADAGWVYVAPGRHEPLLRARRSTGADGAARADLGADASRSSAAGPAPSRTRAAWRACLARRSETSQQFFATSAGQWDRLRDELFGARVRARRAARPAAARLGRRRSRLRHRRDAAGAGAARRARHRRRRVGRDAGGRARPRDAICRTSSCGAARSRRCRSTTASLDAATMMLVLHHLPSPAAALRKPRAC